MTSLELWCFACITCTFGALMSYVIILIRMEYMRQWNKNIIKEKPYLCEKKFGSW